MVNGNSIVKFADIALYMTVKGSTQLGNIILNWWKSISARTHKHAYEKQKLQRKKNIYFALRNELSHKVHNGKFTTIIL